MLAKISENVLFLQLTPHVLTMLLGKVVPKTLKLANYQYVYVLIVGLFEGARFQYLSRMRSFTNLCVRRFSHARLSLQRLYMYIYNLLTSYIKCPPPGDRIERRWIQRVALQIRLHKADQQIEKERNLLLRATITNGMVRKKQYKHSYFMYVHILQKII